MDYYVYILRCADDSLYTGSTSNLDQRVKDHNSGKGCFSTRNKRPVKLVYYEVYDKKKTAFLREKQIKRWTREKKENLVRFGHPKGE